VPELCGRERIANIRQAFNIRERLNPLPFKVPGGLLGRPPQKEGPLTGGSNHALATAIYAGQVGLKSISMLMPQPNADYVHRNLVMSHCCGAEVHWCGAELESARNLHIVVLIIYYISD